METLPSPEYLPLPPSRYAVHTAVACLLALSLFLAARSYAAEPPVRMDFVGTDELLANPGIGWQTFHRSAAQDKNLEGLPSGSSYYRFYWREIEPEDVKPDFAQIDALAGLAHASGQKLAFRLMCLGSGETTDVPAWLIKNGCKGAEYDYDGKKHWIPDFTDPVFQRAHARLVHALGQRYDGRPDFGPVDIGSVGMWGEWNMAGVTSPETKQPVDLPPVAVQNAVIDLWEESFPKTPKMVLIGSDTVMARTVREGLGWRADCLGDMGGFSKNWNHMRDIYPAQIFKGGAADAWKKGPVAFESCWEMNKWTKEGWDVRAIFDYALSCHASLMNNKSARIPDGARPEIERFLRKLGYRLVLHRIEHPPSTAPGAAFSIKIAIENIGVAPPYNDYRIAFRLTDPAAPDAKPIVLASSESIQGFLPGAKETDVALTLPASIAVGPRQLAIGIVDPASHAPVIRMAIAGREADGWYPAGKVVIR